MTAFCQRRGLLSRGPFGRRQSRTRPAAFASARLSAMRAVRATASTSATKMRVASLSPPRKRYSASERPLERRNTPQARPAESTNCKVAAAAIMQEFLRSFTGLSKMVPPSCGMSPAGCVPEWTPRTPSPPVRSSQRSPCPRSGRPATRRRAGVLGSRPPAPSAGGRPSDEFDACSGSARRLAPVECPAGALRHLIQTARGRARASIDRANVAGLTAVPWFADAYPARLASIPDPPIVLVGDRRCPHDRRAGGRRRGVAPGDADGAVDRAAARGRAGGGRTVRRQRTGARRGRRRPHRCARPGGPHRGRPRLRGGRGSILGNTRRWRPAYPESPAPSSASSRRRTPPLPPHFSPPQPHHQRPGSERWSSSRHRKRAGRSSPPGWPWNRAGTCSPCPGACSRASTAGRTLSYKGWRAFGRDCGGRSRGDRLDCPNGGVAGRGDTCRSPAAS